MSWRCPVGLLAVVMLASAAPAAQQPPQPGASPQTIVDGQVIRTAAAMVRVSAISGFVYPWALAFLPNGDMLVTEQGRNTLRVVRNGVLDPTPITGLPQGITSTRRDTAGVDIAVHPRFAENRYIYVAYWKPTPGSVAAGPGANIRTAVLIRARYDGGPTLNDDGSVPQDNPFVGRPGYKPEIFALGIRNALGLTIHPDTGELWETENGPQGGDEVNIIRAGKNYGWPVITYGRAYTFDTEGKSSGLPPPTVQ